MIHQPEAAPAAVTAEPLDVRVQPVRSAWLAEVWASVEPLIRAAVAEGPGDESVADILEMLSRRDYQLWLVLVDNAVKAAVVTQIVVRPRAKVCRVAYLGGADLETWGDRLAEAVSSWAGQAGCDAIEFYGRKGWAKFAKRLGVSQVSTVWRKAI